MNVSSLNTKIKSLLEATFMHIKVEGEIASVTHHQSSGHIYFSIKDDKSSIKCVMFRSNATKLKFHLEQGEHIVVEGSIGVFAPRGEYQFYATHIEPYGKGALALAYEQLKAKLQEKGYFEASHKKTIPKSIQKIALVTAKESAALYDMLKIIQKRYRLVSVTVLDTLVQGERASGEISTALKYADTLGVDVIVVGRGGGSTEDLWAFNEEIVADAIYNLKTPIVSAVGHEIDLMISDFVADLRAPTPSAAIEMILPDSQELLYMLDESLERYNQRLKQIVFQKKEQLHYASESLQRQSVKRKLKELFKEFDNISSEYKKVMRYRLQNLQSKPKEIQQRLKMQSNFLQNKYIQRVAFLQEQYKLNNPNSGIKEGWAKISVDGKKSKLADIRLGETFTLEEKNIKMIAICQEKNNF